MLEEWMGTLSCWSCQFCISTFLLIFVAQHPKSTTYPVDNTLCHLLILVVRIHHARYHLNNKNRRHIFYYLDVSVDLSCFLRCWRCMMAAEILFLSLIHTAIYHHCWWSFLELESFLTWSSMSSSIFKQSCFCCFTSNLRLNCVDTHHIVEYSIKIKWTDYLFLLNFSIILFMAIRRSSFTICWNLAIIFFCFRWCMACETLVSSCLKLILVGSGSSISCYLCYFKNYITKSLLGLLDNLHLSITKFLTTFMATLLFGTLQLIV